MKVGIVFFIMALILGLVGTLAGTSYHYMKNLDVYEKEVKDHLETAAQSRANHVSYFIDANLEKLKLASSRTKMRSALKSYIDNPNEGDVEVMRAILKDALDSNEGFNSMCIVDLDGNILVSIEKSFEGRSCVEEEFFEKGLEENSFLVVDDELFGPIIHLAGPLTLEGERIGVLFIRADLNSLWEITFDKTGLGETGEIYLINEESYAITPLAKRSDTFLKFKVDSINSRNCFEHFKEESEESLNFLDYNGEEVIGTYKPIYEKNWCLLAEINEDEIIGKQRRLFQRVVIEIIIVLTIFVALVSYFVGRQLDKIFIYKKSKRRL